MAKTNSLWIYESNGLGNVVADCVKQAARSGCSLTVRSTLPPKVALRIASASVSLLGYILTHDDRWLDLRHPETR